VCANNCTPSSKQQEQQEPDVPDARLDARRRYADLICLAGRSFDCSLDNLSEEGRCSVSAVLRMCGEETLDDEDFGVCFSTGSSLSPLGPRGDVMCFLNLLGGDGYLPFLSGSGLRV
jgi:hypothetical protein